MNKIYIQENNWLICKKFIVSTMAKFKLKSETMTEEEIQFLVIEWAISMQDRHPELKWLHSSLNGVKLSIGQARKAKRSGMKSGISDLCLPFKNNEYSTLYIELKRKGGRVSDNQKEFIDFINTNGGYACVAYSAIEAITKIKIYLKNK